MSFSIKTKIWNGSFLLFLFLAIFSMGFFALADEQAAVTAYFEDSDGDGLSIDEEKAYGTDPANNDTDGDSYSDGVEIQSGYDPLKPAPGDRITPDDVTTSNPETRDGSNQSTSSSASATPDTATSADSTKNLTDIATEELKNVVAEKQGEGKELTADDLNVAVAKVLESANDEVELPEVAVEEIKVKELPKKLSDDEAKEKTREDTVQYLTTVGYILMSNSPTAIRSQSDLQSLANESGQKALLALASGNTQSLSDFKARGERIIEEIKTVEVPANMLGTHVKALKLVGFVNKTIDTISSVDPNTDPIGQMSQLAKIQGGLSEMQNFLGEITNQLTDLGLRDMPLDAIGLESPSSMSTTP